MAFHIPYNSWVTVMTLGLLSDLWTSIDSLVHMWFFIFHMWLLDFHTFTLSFFLKIHNYIPQHVGKYMDNIWLCDDTLRGHELATMTQDFIVMYPCQVPLFAAMSCILDYRFDLYFIFTLQMVFDQCWNLLSHHEMSSFCHGPGSLHVFMMVLLCASSLQKWFFVPSPWLPWAPSCHVEVIHLPMKFTHDKARSVWKSSILSLL